jgi:hypothetical protein
MENLWRIHISCSTWGFEYLNPILFSLNFISHFSLSWLIGFCHQLFLLMRDFYYSETLLDFLPYNNTDFMFTYQACYNTITRFQCITITLTLQRKPTFVIYLLSYIFREECSNKGGSNDGSCAAGFGVCCVCKFQKNKFKKWNFTEIFPNFTYRGSPPYAHFGT